mgnify:CR=1 FL=1
MRHTPGLTAAMAAILPALMLSAALAQTRNFKLARTTETRSTCPYCSVSCGLVMYTLGDKAKNVKSTIIHVEGDPDHPVNRGTLCPKGAGVLAQRIRRLALENNIPVVERKPLAQLLYKEVDIGKPVPTDSYAAVAEVLAYVYQLKGKKLPAPPKVA